MAIRIQLRRGTAAEWLTANTTLSLGEMGLETDTGYLKIGDGTTAWANLIYNVAGTALNANNATYLGGIYATDYQKRSGLAANVAKLNANNTLYLGGIAANAYQTISELANSIVNLAVSEANSALYANSALFSNSAVYSNSALYLGALAASGYQTNAGLAGNVAILAANSATYLGGNTASDLRTYSDTQANSAYSNAVSYANSTAYNYANSAYANAVSYTDTAVNSAKAYANSTAYNYASESYTNSVSYTNLAANSAYTNAVSYANTTAYDYANAAYSNAITYANSTAYNYANAAYANAVSYADIVANSAYSNAVTFANTVANSAYSNAVTYANNIAYIAANSAYSNAISYANTTAYNYANAAYVNAVSYVNTYFAPLSGASFTGDINISGNLYVNGTTVSLNSATLDVKDTNITIAKGIPNAGAADGAGLTIEGANATITYVYGSNSINFSHSIRVGNSTVNSFINSTSFSGDANTVNGSSASDLRDHANIVANTAYANAIIFANNVANSAYNNAVSYATEVSNAAYTNAVSYADTAAGNAYTTAIAYVNNHILDSVSNSSITYMASANSVKRAYDAAVSAGNSAAAYANAVIYANNAANSAYANAIAYANTIAYTAANSAYSNAILYADIAANSAYVNAVSYAGDVYDSAVAYANTIAYETANSAYSNAIAYADIAANSAYVNAVSYANTTAYNYANAAYSNAISYAASVANAAYVNSTSYAASVANSAYVNAVSYANSTAYDYANAAYANAVSYTDIAANAAYTNAVSYAASAANSAYVNAVSYANSTAYNYANAAYANAISYADIAANAAYSNAVSYADIAANSAYSNAVSYANSIARSIANSAYSNAVSYADIVANSAYVNAVSYANTAYANAITWSNTIAYIAANAAYTNAIAYANTIAYTAANSAYTNAVSYADIVANSAYNNAVSIAYASSNSAYTNAINYASNASNITTGTLPIDRLPSGVVNTTGNFIFTGVHTHDANLAVNAALILSGSPGTAGQVLTSNGTNNVYWSDVLVSAVTSVDTANGLAGGPITSTGTLYVLANTGIVANSTGTFVNAAYINTISANAATYLNGKTEENLNVNSALFANNSAYLNGQPASYYTNATNISTGTLDTARLPATANISTAINVGANVNLTTSSINVGSVAIKANSIVVAANASIDFNTTTYKPAFQKGRMYWDNEEQTIVVYGDGSSFEQSMGQREWVRCHNSTASTIAKGTPVYITGVHIPGDPVHGHHPTIAPGDASDYNKSQIIGITGEEILAGDHGYVVVRGYVEEIDTSGLVAGERAHLGFTTPGTIVASAPEYPNYPTDLGMCLTSNSTVGTFYVDLAMHTAERFRTTADMYVGGDLSVAGALRITGNVTSTSVNNLSIKDNLIYLASGDTIGNTQFTGSGLNDMLFHGVYEGTSTVTYYVKIDSLGGTAFLPDTFSWSKDNFATTEDTGVTITADYQTLDNGITIKFNDINDHTLDDVWYGVVAPINVDLGWVGNYNDTSYKHTGLFRDATDGVYKFFQGYIPEPDAAVNIDTGHASFELATVQANVFVGDLNGTANNADKLGGVAAASYVTTSSIGGLTANASNYLGGNSAADLRYYANTLANSAYVNAVSYANSIAYIAANSAYTNAINYANSIAYIAANSAYVNAVSYVDNKSYVNSSQISSFVNSTNLSSNLSNYAALDGAVFTGNASFSSNIYAGTIVGNNGLMIQQENAGSYLVLNNNGHEWKIYPSGPMEAGGALIGGSYGANKVELSGAAILEGGNFGTQIKSSLDRSTYYTWTFGGEGLLVLPGGISANGSNGVAGQVLKTSNTGNVYWADATSAGVTSVATGNGMTGGPITSTGTVSVLANSGIVANSTGTFVNSAYIATISANATTYLNGKTEENLNVNSASNATYLAGKSESNLNVNSALIANSAAYLGGTIATDYATKTYVTGLGYLSSIPASYIQNTDSRTLSGNLNFTGANTTFNGNATFKADIIDSTGSRGDAGQVLASNGSGNIYWTTVTTSIPASYVQNTDSRVLSGNLSFSAANVIFGNSTVYATINSTVYSASANNTTYVNGKTESNLNVNSSISSNTANTANYVIANSGIVSNSTGVFVNASYIATIAANSATYLNGKTEDNLNVNSAFTSNNSGYLGGTIATDYATKTYVTGLGYLSSVSASYVQNTDSRTLSGNIQFSAANVTIGNSTVYATINSTVYSGTANNALYLGGILASSYVTGTPWTSQGYLTSIPASYVQNTDSRTLSGNLNFTGANSYFSGKTTFNANVVLNAGISLIDSTGSQGTVGQVLASNGTGNVYWSSVGGGTGTVTSVGSGNGLTGGPITASGSLSVLANSGIVANTTGVFVNAAYIATISANAATYLNGKTESNLNVNSSITSNTANTANYVVANSGIVSNAAGVFVNAAYIATISANAAAYLGTTAAANFVQNTDSRTLSGNLNFTGANSYFSGKTTFNSNVVLNPGISLIDSLGNQGTAGQVLASNGAGNVYWSSVSGAGSSTSALTQTFTGDGSTTNFTLTTSVAGQNNIIVSMNGLVQIPVTHYTISGTTLSFTTAPYTGAVVEARNFENGSSGSGVSVNVNAQYAWSNTQTFTNSITFSTNILVGTSVNAASHTIGTTFVANTITLNSNGVVVNSTAGFFSGYVNASAFATTGNANVGNVNASSTISDGIGNIRSIPVNTQSSAYELANSDNGKCISISSGGVTVNGATIVIGHTSVIFNNSGSTQTITIGTGGTMYLSGNSTSANRTLAVRGVCTVLMVASNTFIISGSLT